MGARRDEGRSLAWGRQRGREHLVLTATVTSTARMLGFFFFSELEAKLTKAAVARVCCAGC